MRATVYTDGGNRREIAAAAIILALEVGKVIERSEAFLGSYTNNQMEYEGVIMALETAIMWGVDDLFILSDSELIVNHLNGEYQVKNEDLKILFERTLFLARELHFVSIKHIPREKNKYADLLCNWTMDDELGLPKNRYSRRLESARKEFSLHTFI